MTVWIVAAAVSMVVGLGLALYFVSRGSSAERLLGVQLSGVTAVLAMIAVSEAVGQTSYLVVPLVLATLMTTGTLVFTRLLRADSPDLRPGEHDRS